MSFSASSAPSVPSSSSSSKAQAASGSGGRPATSTAASSKSTPPSGKAKAAPHNLFSNDGSFLERFKQLKQAEVTSKGDAALLRKKAMEDRIRNRGKRIASPTNDDSPESKRKRAGNDAEDAYTREVRRLERGTLKDSGSGVRPLTK